MVYSRHPQIWTTPAEFSSKPNLCLTSRLDLRGKIRGALVYSVCREILVTLTNCGEDVGKAEVVHRVEREEMVEELLFLIITAQESVALIEFPSNKYKHIKPYSTNLITKALKEKVKCMNKEPEKMSLNAFRVRRGHHKAFFTEDEPLYGSRPINNF